MAGCLEGRRVWPRRVAMENRRADEVGVIEEGKRIEGERRSWAS